MTPPSALPQLDGRLFLTDGGIETSLIFLDGLDLPHFAAFPLLETVEGRRALDDYFDAYVAVAARHGAGLVLESATWRANPDWGALLGYDAEGLDAVNRDAIAQVRGVRERHRGAAVPIVVSGCIGPRGDGYIVEEAMTAEDAADYHGPQVRSLAAAEADLVTAITMTSAAEATGIVLAARDAGVPVVISFTVETDGRLPSGESLSEAIVATDEATGGSASYFMINCAHPTHVAAAVDEPDPAFGRVRGIRANASTRSHAELDEAEELDAGDPEDLAARCAALTRVLPRLTILGGCCGTDERHIDAIGAACAPLFDSR
ncbi:homocysteine S-methyltransferase family protein [Yonghaparkia sp. Root332]|uniref:homocysteine S-methyltransferase family protein n=1 Tax=Yonghaparkia sp. Root332 TaxID=1736516 RepID=UPI0006FBD489|nr:homocysteine S-methyltransferase family protein [Yonghaparkia sp. Root332]KQV24611.1 homocysteine methyltransferase [Yonghaparkia sp. Root332]